MEHPSNDHKDHPNQHENSHKQCDETRLPVLNMMKSHWKLRRQDDQSFPMEGKPWKENPALLLLYIHDLPNVICNIVIYADDNTVYSKCDKN